MGGGKRGPGFYFISFVQKVLYLQLSCLINELYKADEIPHDNSKYACFLSFIPPDVASIHYVQHTS